jgi:hypothetical protein
MHLSSTFCVKALFRPHVLVFPHLHLHLKIPKIYTFPTWYFPLSAPPLPLPWVTVSPTANAKPTDLSNVHQILYSWDRASLDTGVVYMTNNMRQIHNILLLEMLYMFRAIIAHHQELGTVCAAVCQQSKTK